MLSFRHTRNFIRKHCAAIGKGDFRHCRNCRNTFYRCRHKSISQLLKRGTYHANATASRYTSDPFRHWNPASDHSIQELIGTGASCLVYTAVCRDGEQNEFYLRLKEFCPENLHLIRQQDGSLLAADEEAFQRQMQSFIWGYQSRCSSGSFRKAATVSAMSRAFLPETAPGILL